ncbi:MAG TPA: hypothetical protein VFM09_10750 [Marmoricola sp.]|nr:hypothetical protein [Marmoricola sp.]
MDRTRSRLAKLLATAGAVAVVGVTAAPAQASEVELHARMHPTAAYPSARGSASYEADHEGTEFELHLAGIGKLAGKRVTVRVHGSFVGRMRVTAAGTASLHRRGGPTCGRGDAVRVRTGAGTLVSSGRFVSEHEDHQT